MVNSIQEYTPQDGHFGSMKSGNNVRRPFQPRSINAPSPSVASSESKTIKPQLNPLKSREEAQNSFRTISENLPTGTSVEKESRAPSLDIRSEELSQPSIFRRISSQRDQDDSDGDMFVLKRANPIYESDEEDYEISPPKRQRSTEPMVLHWDEHISVSLSETQSFTF